MKLYVDVEYLQAFIVTKEQTCQVISSLCRSLGIECTQTTAYHPQGNGQVERFNYTLEAMLAKLVKENQKDWDLHIPKVLFVYRTVLHEPMGYSPYRVNFGQSPNLSVDVMLGTDPLPREGDDKEIPEFIDVNFSLKGVYNDVRWKLNEVHQRNNQNMMRK